MKRPLSLGSPPAWLGPLGRSMRRWPAAVGALLCSGLAEAHDFEVHVISATPDWCQVLHDEIHVADVVELLPGTYPGGCDLTIGGVPELNEALVVLGVGEERTIIAADDDGLSLRVSGEPTRLYNLAMEGRLEVVANNVTVDDSSVGCLEVDPSLARFALLFSEVSEVEVFTADTVVRGNQIDRLDVGALTGLVADNVVRGDLSASIATHRNLVLGDLLVEDDAHFNIVAGTTTAEAALYGNTLLGPVTRAADARNNLTAVAELPTADGNLHCPTCFADVGQLDVQPTGEALVAPQVEAPGALLNYCLQPPETVGAVGVLGAPWSPTERDLFGCAPGLVEAPLPPPDTCVDPVVDTGAPDTADTGTPTEPRGGRDTGAADTGETAPGPGTHTTPNPPRSATSEGGCQTVAVPGATAPVAWCLSLLLLVARRR